MDDKIEIPLDRDETIRMTETEVSRPVDAPEAEPPREESREFASLIMRRTYSSAYSDTPDSASLSFTSTKDGVTITHFERKIRRKHAYKAMSRLMDEEMINEYCRVLPMIDNFYPED